MRNVAAADAVHVDAGAAASAVTVCCFVVIVITVRFAVATADIVMPVRLVLWHAPALISCYLSCTRYWIILDELNLAPSEVLEALNRLLDDNRSVERAVPLLCARTFVVNS